MKRAAIVGSRTYANEAAVRSSTRSLLAAGQLLDRA